MVGAVAPLGVLAGTHSPTRLWVLPSDFIGVGAADCTALPASGVGVPLEVAVPFEAVTLGSAAAVEPAVEDVEVVEPLHPTITQATQTARNRRPVDMIGSVAIFVAKRFLAQYAASY